MENISALMDGELEHDEAASVIPALNKRSDLREAWATYHLIGEALRGQACTDCAVAQSVSSKLAVEPTVLAPRKNVSSFGKRWALPSMAAAAAVAAVTWMGLTTQTPPGLQEFAATAQPVSIGIGGAEFFPSSVNTWPLSATTVEGTSQQGAPPIQLSWREFQAYLMAHHEFSPSISMQGLAPLVRTVSSPGAVER
jgi:sigma-E factor negative regulatory protein RseA